MKSGYRSHIVYHVVADSDEAATTANPIRRPAEGPDELLSTNEDDNGTVSQFPVPLTYLYRFTESEIKALEDKYSLDRRQLDDWVIQYKWRYRAFCSENWLAIGSRLPLSSWRVITNSMGLQTVPKFFSEDYAFSDGEVLLLSLPLAVGDAAFTVSAVSAAKEAILSTLAYANRESLAERTLTLISDMHENPAKAFTLIAKWSFYKTVTYTHNLLDASAYLIPLYAPITLSLPGVERVIAPPLMPLLPTEVQIGIGLVVAYGGNRFNALFFNTDYRQNFDEFWVQGIEDLWNNNPAGSPWVLGELYRGNIITPCHLALQGLGVVAVRAYPIFFGYAEKLFDKILGIGSTATTGLASACAALVAWQTLCVYYPATYKRYMAGHIKTEALLKKKVEETLGETINSFVDTEIQQLELAMNPKLIEQRKVALRNRLVQNFVDSTKGLYEDQLKETYGNRYPFKKNSSLTFLLSYRALISLYLGYNVLTPFLRNTLVDEPTSMALLGISLSAALLVGTPYLAERKRIIEELIVEQLAPKITAEKTGRGYFANDRAADCLAISGNVPRALETLGALGNSNSLGMATAAILALETLVNGICFARDKIYSTIRGWSRFPKVSQAGATMFSQVYSNGPNNATMALGQQASGWRSYCPWGR